MGKVILIVEDDNFVRELYQHAFERRGFETKVAEDGEKALKVVKETKFDTILLDIMLPKVDGIEVLRRIKEDPSTKNIPVVILSNLGQDEIIKRALEVGAKAYIVKSLYTPEQVVEEVRSVISA